jgi:hypothetical protein
MERNLSGPQQRAVKAYIKALEFEGLRLVKGAVKCVPCGQVIKFDGLRDF